MSQHKEPPEEIYLQWYELDQYSMHEGITWCTDKINNSDVKYIRKDIAKENKSAKSA
jgi:hypothetical protein